MEERGETGERGSREGPGTVKLCQTGCYNESIYIYKIYVAYGSASVLFLEYILYHSQVGRRSFVIAHPHPVYVWSHLVTRLYIYFLTAYCASFSVDGVTSLWVMTELYHCS